MIIVNKIFYATIDSNRSDIMGKPPSDTIEIRKYDEEYSTGFSYACKVKEVQSELVKLQRFIKPNGEEIFVGYTEEVGEILGYQNSYVEKLEKQIKDLIRDSWRVTREINNASLWARIKWLFKKPEV